MNLHSGNEYKRDTEKNHKIVTYDEVFRRKLQHMRESFNPVKMFCSASVLFWHSRCYLLVLKILRKMVKLLRLIFSNINITLLLKQSPIFCGKLIVNLIV